MLNAYKCVIDRNEHRQEENFVFSTRPRSEAFIYRYFEFIFFISIASKKAST